MGFFVQYAQKEFVFRIAPSENVGFDCVGQCFLSVPQSEQNEGEQRRSSGLDISAQLLGAFDRYCFIGRGAKLHFYIRYFLQFAFGQLERQAIRSRKNLLEAILYLSLLTGT